MSGSNQIEGGAVDNAMGGQLLYTSYTITMGRLQVNNAQRGIYKGIFRGICRRNSN